mgnify:CR=1 FL=1
MFIQNQNYQNKQSNICKLVNNKKKNQFKQGYTEETRIMTGNEGKIQLATFKQVIK